MQRIIGEFTVELTPQQDEKAMGRMLLSKAYSGDLSGNSFGQMLSVRTDEPGSAGYVAMETVTGALAGKNGTFSLQHSGIMSRGKQQLTIVVVPDSATGELTGLYGNMQIQNVDGKHFYDFEYAFAK